MALDIGFVGSAVVLGIAYAAVPGAVNAEALRRGMTGGFRPAALVQLGSLVGDAAWAAVGLTGAAVLLRFEGVAFALALVGAGFLLALARSAFRAAMTGGDPAATARTGRSFAVGLVFGLANPAGIAFWAGVGGGALAAGGAPSGTTAALFLAAFLCGNATWGLGMAAALGWGRRFVGTRFFRWVNALCGLTLGWFGLRLLVDAVRRLARWAPLLRAAV